MLISSQLSRTSETAKDLQNANLGLSDCAKIADLKKIAAIKVKETTTRNTDVRGRKFYA